MENKLFIGNLSYSTTNESLKDAFAKFGNVISANVIMERETGRSKGFGFVEMSSAEEAQAAIAGMDNADLDGRAIRVSVARPKEDKPRGDFGGSRRSW